MENLKIDIDPQLKKDVETILLQKGVNPADLVKSLYEAIRQQKGIPVFTNPASMDTTEYLLSSPENAERLLESKKDTKERKNLIPVEWNEELDRFVEKKST